MLGFWLLCGRSAGGGVVGDGGDVDGGTGWSRCDSIGVFFGLWDGDGAVGW